MLHPDALAGLYQRACECRGAILELGAHTGGATIVLAKAAMASHNPAPQIAVEVGGAHVHPTAACDDIIASLSENLRQHGVAERVTLLRGWSNEVVDQVGAKLAGRKIGLLLIDADGDLNRDFNLYRRHLAHGATVVIDDYVVEEPNVKCATVQDYVHRMIAEGSLRQLTVLAYGTWFGTYLDQSTHPDTKAAATRTP